MEIQSPNFKIQNFGFRIYDLGSPPKAVVGNPVGSRKMKGLSKKQREVLIGLVLGDGFLQATGKKNARLRLEHSIKQKSYLDWKYEVLKNFMQSKPKQIDRFNPVWKRSYSYYRCQSHATPYLGKLRRLFYSGNRKIVPNNIESLLKSPQSLAVWYMDDGNFYHRDGIAEIYLPSYSKDDLQRLVGTLEANFDLKPKVKIKKKKYPVFNFNVEQTRHLLEIVKPYLVPSLEYKYFPTP